MSWHSLGEFAAMGGYGAYVWGAFGVVFALMAAEVGALAWRWRALRRGLGAALPARGGP